MSKDKVAPFQIDTTDISEAMKMAALKFKIPIEKVDFDINTITTFKKGSFSKTAAQITTATEDDLRNENINIHQSYNLTMKEVDKEKNDLLPNLVFSGNISHTHAFLVIKEGSVLNLDKISKTELIDHFEKTILKNHCFARISEELNIANHVNDIYENYLGVEKSNDIIKIKIIDFPEPTESKIDRLEDVYANAKKNKDGSKLKKSSIKQGETIFRYHHVTKGQNGRRYNGQIIKKHDLSPRNIPKMLTDKDTVEVIREKKWTDYRARQTGYVSLEKNKLRIIHEAEFLSANIRNQDKLVTNLDDGVTLNIKNDSALDDAVGSNMKLASDKINIQGNVGSSSEVKGNVVFIGGQTHSTSTVIGKSVKIGTLKGKAKAEKLYINILENGEAFGDTVKIKQARGGYIKGDNIIIGTLDSNVKIIASSSIIIDNIKGGNNNLYLQPKESNDEGTKGYSIDDLLEKIELLEEEIIGDKKKLKEKEFKIKFNEKSLDVQRDDKIDKLQYNIKANPSMSNKLKSHMKTYEERDNIEKKIKIKEKKIKSLQKTLKSLSQSTKGARVELRNEWSEGNSIRIFYDAKEYLYCPIEGEVRSPISYDILKKSNLI